MFKNNSIGIFSEFLLHWNIARDMLWDPWMALRVTSQREVTDGYQLPFRKKTHTQNILHPKYYSTTLGFLNK
ncbi:hypothetical protein C0J52_07060 [Blattella germanica]|nr:hypothetical protein C0J52_07060 [Blattella germanica]